MAQGDTLKYAFFIPETQERYEVADLDKLKEMYPTAHITHRIVDDGTGAGMRVDYTGKQPYEVAAEKAEKEAARLAAEQEARLSEIRGMTVTELRDTLGDAAPADAKKDDLVALVAESEGVPLEPVAETPAVPAGDASVSEIEAPLAGEPTDQLDPAIEQMQDSLEAADSTVSRDTRRRVR